MNKISSSPLISLLCFPIFLSGCASAPITPTPATPTATVTPVPAIPTPTGLAAPSKEVDAIMAAFVTEDSPGGAVIVIQQGQIVHKAGYGLADLATGRLITPQTIFHLGSMGKQFTGLAIMMLAEEGKLAYDDPIGRHLPELARFGKDVTIRRLLHHTSGMPDYYEDEELYEALLDMADRPANQEALALLVERGELQATPGETFAYSNTGYEVLGSLIERVSGQPFPRFMQERVFEPVGMKNTFSLPNPDRLASPDLAHSYIRSGSQVEAYDSDPFDDLVGSGSVYSTVEDMYLYDQALTGGKLVKLSTLAEAFKSAVLNDGEETDYGFGWYFDQHAGRRYVAHDGEWLGFQSFYVRFPEQQLSVIILLNRTYDLPWIGEIGLEIAELYLKRP